MFDNGDFAIARGVEFTLRTRRVGGFLGLVNYTLTDAKGTNSEPGGQVAALENGKHVLCEKPLDATLERAEALVEACEDAGVIGQRDASEGPLLTDVDPRNRVPLEPLNSSTTPWYFNTDMRVEKGFNLGPAAASVYLYVQNLFDTRNVLNVYNRTGAAETDGFLTSPDLSSEIVAGRGQEYVDYYRAINLLNRHHWLNDAGVNADLYSEPRQVRLGVQMSF